MAKTSAKADMRILKDAVVSTEIFHEEYVRSALGFNDRHRDGSRRLKLCMYELGTITEDQGQELVRVINKAFGDRLEYKLTRVYGNPILVYLKG